MAAEAVAYMLSESRTTDYRHYVLWPVRGYCFDAILVIQVGKVGPRGGTSKMSITTYLVQEAVNDPDEPARPGRTFLLAKPHGEFRRVEDIVDPDECVYEIHIPPRGTIGYCTCPGGKMVGNCKHRDTLEHLTQVVGIGADFRVPQPDDEVIRCGCGNDPTCEICEGIGYIVVDT